MRISENLDVQYSGGIVSVSDREGRLVTFSKDQSIQRKVSMVLLGEPQARQISRELGYGDDEIIQAVCWVSDKQRTNPPHSNRTAWFTTVFREKIQEAHADILAYQRRKSRELEIFTP